jgi:hypothetical protein
MGNVDTTIGYDNITLSGEICVNKNVFYEDEREVDIAQHFEWRMIIGSVTLLCWYETDFIYDRNEFCYAFATLGAGAAPDNWRDHIKIINRPFSLGEDLCLPFSINVSGYHIRRTYGIDISGPFGSGRMKPNEENPSPNPTHSIEMYAADNWITDDDPGEIHVTFGDLSWDIINGENNPPEGEPFWATILPSDAIYLESCKYQADDAMTSCTTTLNTNLFPYNFDHVNISEEVPVVGSDVYCYLTGSGNKLEWWNDGGFGGRHTCCLGVPLYPPLVVDWSGYGLCDWGETKHNERYDDVLVWGGFRKVPEMDGKISWPHKSETQVPMASEDDDFEYGDGIPVRLGDLHKLGVYAQPPLGGDNCRFWEGPNILLHVDRKSHIKHNLYPKGDLEHPLRFPIGIPHLLNPMPDASPRFEIPVERYNVAIDIPQGTTKRPSVWECDDDHIANLLPKLEEPVQFNTTEKKPFTLYRNLQSSWLPRCQALIDYGNQTGNWAPFPTSYIIRRANYFGQVFDDWDWQDIEDKTGYIIGPEDVSCYSSHRYLKVKLRTWVEDMGWLPGTSATVGDDGYKLTLTHHEEQVSDSHILDLTGASGIREVTVSLGPPQQTTFEGKDHPDGDAIVFDFAEHLPDIPDLRHVSKIELFVDNTADDRVWELVDVELYDAVAKPQALATMHEARHAYVSGGVRGVVNGLYEHALCAPGNFRVYNGHEPLVELINWYWTQTLQLTLDGSTAWQLEDFLILLSGCCEGWNWRLPDNWDAMVLDADDNRLTFGYSFDFEEAQDTIVVAGATDSSQPPDAYAGRIGAYRWQAAPHLVYKPHGVVCVQGGMHGFADDTDRLNYVSIYHKPEGMPETNWLIHKYASVNGYAYWATGDDIVYAYNDTTPVFWNYRVGKKGTPIPRLYERQWPHRYYESSLDRFDGGINAMRDPWDIIWEAYTIGGNVYVRRLNRQLLSWGPSVLVASVGNDASQPSISRNHSGLLYVSVLAGSESNPITFYSDDVGRTWVQFDAGNNDNGDDDNGNGDDG